MYYIRGGEHLKHTKMENLTPCVLVVSKHVISKDGLPYNKTFDSLKDVAEQLKLEAPKSKLWKNLEVYTLDAFFEHVNDCVTEVHTNWACPILIKN